MKAFVKKILHSLLPDSIYKLLANKPCIVPRYYKGLIGELEQYFDYAREETPEKNLLLLRKNAHILDKGVQQENAEPGHGKQCYLDLKKRLAQIPAEWENDPTVVWSRHVLCNYEKLQQGGLRTEHAECSSSACVSYDDLFTLIRQRRSNRCFLNKEIAPETAHSLVKTVHWAASSCNKQPIQVFYTINPDVASVSLKCCKGGTGFSSFIPSLWVFTADTRGYVWPGEAPLPFIDTSLGTQNLFLAATTLGISGTVLSWCQHTKEEEQQLRSLMRIPPEYIIVFCAVLGYAKYDYAVPARKE